MSLKSAPEPTPPSPMPRKPWEIVHIDLCAPSPSGESLLVVQDVCSRWPEVAILRLTIADAIIKQLKRIFATHGSPETITSDNGPQFVSKPSQDFIDIHGIRHRKITLYRPQANGQVERFNQPLEKTIRGAQIERKDWRQEIYSFLMNFRATPHAVTGVTPSRQLVR